MDVHTFEEGAGPVTVLLVGPGLDDGTRCKGLAKLLAPRYRTVRLCRRQYRLDLEPCSIADEVDDLVAVSKTLGEPVIIYGHSSGAVVALETLVRAPELFAGAVIFEPPSVIGPPLGGEAADRARAALAAGKPGKAFQIFLRDAVEMPAGQAWFVGKVVGLTPQFRNLVPRQISDMDAIDDLGVRLDAYAQIKVPAVLLSGDRSPAHLIRRLDAIEQVMPNAERLVMHKLDHGADLKAPQEIVRAIDKIRDSSQR
jgi:pimeloyl-ACP methyl ester carboxylesterase